MLEHIYALSMVFMEMLFLFTVLLALYHQRKVIGDSAFLMIMALAITEQYQPLRDSRIRMVHHFLQRCVHR